MQLFIGSGIAGVATLATLLNKTSIRANLSEYTPDIAAVHAQGLTYVFGSVVNFALLSRQLKFICPAYRETNSYYDHGAPDVSDAGGAAIWAVDYILFAAILGIRRLHFHEGIGYRYNFVRPHLCLARSATH